MQSHPPSIPLVSPDYLFLQTAPPSHTRLSFPWYDGSFLDSFPCPPILAIPKNANVRSMEARVMKNRKIPGKEIRPWKLLERYIAVFLHGYLWRLASDCMEWIDFNPVLKNLSCSIFTATGRRPVGGAGQQRILCCYQEAGMSTNNLKYETQC